MLIKRLSAIFALFIFTSILLGACGEEEQDVTIPPSPTNTPFSAATPQKMYTNPPASELTAAALTVAVTPAVILARPGRSPVVLTDRNQIPPTLAPAVPTPAPPQPAVAQVQPVTTAAQVTTAASAGNGNTQQAGIYKVTLNNMEKGELYQQFIKAQEGNTFISFDMTVESLGDGASVNPFYCKLVDSDGFNYTTTLPVKTPSLAAENDLVKGQKIRGWVSFEIPKKAKGLKFVYSPPSLFEKINITFNLG